MRDIDLFQMALSLVPPWMVAAADFDAERKRLDIEIDFKAAAALLVPNAARPTVRYTTPSRRPGATWISSSIRPSCTPASPASTAPTVAFASSMYRGRGRDPALRSCSRRSP